MLRLALVTTALAIFIAFSGLASISPAQQKKDSLAKQKDDDLAAQVKTLREEVRRLSARVAELEKQGPSLWTASQQAPPCDEVIPQVLLPAKIEWQIPVQGSHACSLLSPAYGHAGTRGRVDFAPYPSPWDEEKCATFCIDYAPFPSPSDYRTSVDLPPNDPWPDPLRCNDQEGLFSTRFNWWAAPTLGLPPISSDPTLPIEPEFLPRPLSPAPFLEDIA
jgi:hypothetical protein